MSTECPSCHYVRQDVDTASPEGQCPRCGIVYAKFDPAVNVRREKLKMISEQRLRRESMLESMRVNAEESRPYRKARWAFFSKAVRLLVVVGGVGTMIYMWMNTPSSRVEITPRYIEDAKRSVAYSFRDPDSVRFRNVRQGRSAVCGEVNGMNGFGGYAGFHRFYVTPEQIAIDNESNHERFERDWDMSC